LIQSIGKFEKSKKFPDQKNTIVLLAAHEKVNPTWGENPEKSRLVGKELLRCSQLEGLKTDRKRRDKIDLHPLGEMGFRWRQGGFRTDGHNGEESV